MGDKICQRSSCGVRFFLRMQRQRSRFCDKYELDSYYSVEADNGEWQQGFDCFLSQVDIVYIKTEQPKREKYIRRSLELGKICDK